MNSTEDFDLARERMVRQQIETRGVSDLSVLSVMREIPRHLFVPEPYKARAYDDCPLPIGHGQTISQPYMVAVMTELLKLKGNEKVLELGTGSGYQAAILAKLARWVYTLDRISELSEKARRNTEACGINNLTFVVADGTKGWPEEAPYDAVMITAGAPTVPKPVFEQLSEGGRMVIPVGDRFSQILKVVEKKQGVKREESYFECRFVDLVGEHGW
ncbi:MAG: protein-L-isoaspartate(D-aspartate) O-methyltransferase [Pseudomonadota bacterium]